MIYKEEIITVASVRPTGEQIKEIMSTNIVNFSFQSQAAVDLQYGDFIEVWGETYYLNQLPEIQKDGDRNYKYSMVFQAKHYSLAKPKFFFYDQNNELTMPEFELMGNVSMFLDLIVANANRKQTGWIKGDYIDSVYKLLPFNGENVLQALDQIASTFETEWWVVNQTIHIAPKGSVSGYNFEYGMDKGIRPGMKRTNVNTSGIFSQLYVQGSDQNLPVGYRNGQRRLQLPAPNTFIQGPKYGPDEIEEIKVFEDIKPKREGTVTAVGDIYTFTDSGMDFDVNNQLYPGIVAKVEFTTGLLAGYIFELNAAGGYDAPNKTFKIIKNEGEKAFDLPSADLKPAIGDKYFLFDIQMPASYVTAAESELLAKGTEYFAESSQPKVGYALLPDHFFFKREDIVLSLGDTVGIKDTGLAVDKQIRTIGFGRDLHNQYKYNSLKIADTVVAAGIVRQYAEAEKLNKIIVINKLRDIQRARMTWKTTAELSTILETLRTEMLLIMIDGGAYQTDIVATTLVGNFSTTAGDVYHEQYTENNGIWHVAAFSSALASNVPYFVYIKASKVDTSATIVLSETRIAVEGVASYYHFPFGIISSIISGGRLLSSMRGYTRVTGGNVVTGRIVSNDGVNFFDLDAGSFNLGDIASGLDYNVTTPGKLTLRGALAQSGSGVTSPLPVFRGPYVIGATYYSGDTVTFGGQTWRFINPTPNNTQAPAEGAYWTLEAAAGAGTASLITPNDKMTIIGNKITKTSGGAAWTDAQVYSLEGFTGGCVLSWKVVGPLAGKTYMMGIDQVPTTDFNYTSIDYCFYVTGAVLSIRENGTTATPASTVVAIGDILSIKYDGLNVTYYKNGTVMRTLQTTANRLFYFDSSFNTVGSVAENVLFTAAGTAGQSAAGAATLIATSTANIVIDGGKITKIAGGTGFNAGAYSLEGYVGGCVVGARASGIAGQVMIGLNDAPTAGVSYTDMEYCWYLQAAGVLNIYESASLVYTGTYVDGDYFQIIYDGLSSVRYYKNGLVIRSTNTTENRLFYLDSSINNVGGTISNISFTGVGKKGVDGAAGYTLMNKVNTLIEGNKVTKIGGAAATWDSNFRSVEPLLGGCIVTFKVVDITKRVMIGLNTDAPASAAGYAAIDYALYQNLGVLTCYESNVHQPFGSPTIVNGDIIGVKYDGNSITYLKNGAVLKTTATTAGRIFYAEGCLYDAGMIVENVTFQATGSKGNFTEYQFAKNGSTTVPPALTNTSLNPAGWSVTQPVIGTAEYMWVIKAEKTGDGSALVGTWSVPVRMNGETGPTGPGGPVGPSNAYKGTYDPGATYIGDATKVQTVYYSGNYYYTRTDAGSFSGVLPTNTSKWNAYGADFESIATGLLLAAAATIENLTVRYVSTSDTGERIVIDGSTNTLIFYDALDNEVFKIADGTVVLSSTSGDSYFSAKQTVSGEVQGAAMGVGIPISFFGVDASVVGHFINKTTTPGKPNFGVYIDVDNADGNNYALYIKNGTLFLDGNTDIVINDVGGLGGTVGLDHDVTVLLSSPPGAVQTLKFRKGVLVVAV